MKTYTVTLTADWTCDRPGKPAICYRAGEVVSDAHEGEAAFLRSRGDTVVENGTTRSTPDKALADKAPTEPKAPADSK